MTEQLRELAERISGDELLLELPTDRPRTHDCGNRRVDEPFAITGIMAGEIDELARRIGTDRGVVLQTAWRLLLHRYSGQRRFAMRVTFAPVGSAGADHQTTEPAAVVDCSDPGLLGFDALARADDSDLMRLLGGPAVQPGDSERRSAPRIQTVRAGFAWYGTGAAVPSGSSEPSVADESTAAAEISLTVIEASAGLKGRLSYDPELFERDTARRMIAHLMTLLGSAYADPCTPARFLTILTSDEAARITRQWGRGRAVGMPDLCLHELFERQADRVPGTVAISCGDARLTYGDLERQANQLARLLRQRGIGPECRVGVFMRRGPEVIVAILAILKAGAAYVPQDRDQPVERTTTALAAAGVSLTVVDASTAGSLTATGLPVLDVDQQATELRTQPSDRPESPAAPSNLAYVIFTSGSTGTPKGSMIEHRSAVNYLLWADSVLPTGHRQGTLVHTRLSFDFTVPCIFLPLMRGTEMVLLPDGARVDEVVDVLTSDADFDFVRLTPSHLEVLDGHLRLRGGSLATKTLFVGGEPLRLELVRSLAARISGLTVLSQYGATEVTVGGCCLDATAVAAARGRGIAPLGRPNPNIEVYVLDEHLQPVPFGVVGEVVFGGAGVGRGYVGSPALTAERFVPDNLSGRCGARLYRTGDLGRYRADGTLEIVGRRDRQVKVNGHRIELGEVEHVLHTDPGVERAIAAVVGPPDGQRRLVAYVQPRSLSKPVTARHLQEVCAAALPPYMVPTSIITVERMQLTPNGKLDVRAVSNHAERISGKPSLSADEQRIARAWQTVLGIDTVRPEDDFFGLGGDSLSAMRVVHLLESAERVQIRLDDVFAHPTLSALAARANKVETLASTAVASGNLGGQPAGALSPTQRGQWLLHQVHPESPIYNVPLAYELTGQIDVSALDQALNLLVGRHEVLRTSFPDSGGVPSLRVHPHVSVALDEVDATGNDPTVLEAQMRLVARTPFDLERAPLLRGSLVRLSADRHILLLCLHHIICDDWSIGIITNELSELYDSIVDSRPARLPTLDIVYSEFAAWYQQWLGGERLERQLDYWRSALTGYVPFDLPTDKPRPNSRPVSGARVEVDLPGSLVDRLRAIAEDNGCTLFMALAAVFQELLARYAERDDVAIVVPVAGRHHPGTESLVGLLINTIILRVHTGGAPTFVEMMKRVRQSALGAFSNSDVPFVRLVQELKPARDRSRQPFAQVSFALQSVTPSPVSFAGMDVRQLSIHNETAKLDLMVEVIPASPTRWSLRAEYATEIFDHDSIHALVLRFRQLLAAAADEPEAQLSVAQLVEEGRPS
ncbi:amino acid adenylation domain-containing protein [Micromonospora sp. NPDC047812]|uniref:amino acid adenylation domain-containing protein n=1 Tax=Micromonospora sp. NPDC047812 TaxID=3155742 RepID=UPI003453C834